MKLTLQYVWIVLQTFKNKLKLATECKWITLSHYDIYVLCCNVSTETGLGGSGASD